MKIIHITNSLPYDIGGVSDYSYTLALELSKHNIISNFITVRNFHNYNTDTFKKIQNINSKRNLFEVVSEMIDKEFSSYKEINVLLQYVPHAYNKRGCPLWLLSDLKKIKTKYPHVKLTTMFHELYATSGNFKTSTFWLQGLQKMITKKIYSLSDSVVTNTLLYKNTLLKWDHKDIKVLPVFSNIGESIEHTFYNPKLPYIIVFGSRTTRMKAYQNHDLLIKVVKKFKIKKILDIGYGKVEVPDTLRSFIEYKGKLASDEIQNIMLNVKFGLINYGNMPLDKSGVFSAYIANGVIPIVLSSYDGECIYEVNKDYIDANIPDFDKIVSNERYFDQASLQKHTEYYIKEFR